MESSVNKISFDMDNLKMNQLVNILLKDKRDAPFVTQILIELFLFLPASFLTYIYSEKIGYFVILYWAFFIYLLGPHLLMLHNICHRSPWKKTFKKPMNTFMEFIGLLLGLPPMLYFHHHIKMHHKEDNGPTDLSSTLNYQRDSFLGWLHYFFRFIFLGPIEIPLYFFRNGRKDYFFKVVLGYLAFYAIVIAAVALNPTGALYIFIVPTLICWFGLMGGNWAQHAFIDSSDPQNNYKNSITIIDCVYNKRCFNDGYHIGHHLSPGRHWSEMPEDFDKNRELYAKNSAMVFRTLDYQIIWLFLMLKNYKRLANYYVPHNGETLSPERIKSLMAPIPLYSSEELKVNA